MRIDGRSALELRPVTITRGVNPYAEGSAEVSFGKTKLLITVSVEKEVPPWMAKDPTAGGWLTAEYGMLPRATHTRNKREAASGKQGGRTLEIQRLIGRALRAAVDLKQLPGLTLRFDCDVICADGGTRTAAITGSWVALHDAIAWAKTKGLVGPDCSINRVAAISLGVVSGELLVDLCYEEDSQADFDLNIVVDENARIIEVQGTAERSPLSHTQMSELLERGIVAAGQLLAHQQRAIEG